ncbi:MAG: carbamate kinase, partial [Bacteroidales bacterium]
FCKEDEKQLDVLSISEAYKYLENGQFAEGSMAPKIRAAIFFVENGGKECIITEASQLGQPKCGTRIIK